MSYSTVSKKSNETYYLHSKDVALKWGVKQTIYYFARSPGNNTVDSLPTGYKVVENPRTGLPMLKRV